MVRNVLIFTAVLASAAALPGRTQAQAYNPPPRSIVRSRPIPPPSVFYRYRPSRPYRPTPSKAYRPSNGGRSPSHKLNLGTWYPSSSGTYGSSTHR